MNTKVFNLIIVDESGSMSSIREQAFSGMNETLQTIRSQAEEHPELDQVVTLITFDSNHTNYHYNNADGKHVASLKWSDYRPGGCTPLYDAVGNGIAKVNEKVGENDTVLVTIITDGYENASREFTLHSIKTLIEALRKNNWTFTFIGTDDIDVEGIADSMGIRQKLAFHKDMEHTRQMFEEEKMRRRRFYGCVGALKMMDATATINDSSMDYFADDEDNKG